MNRWIVVFLQALLMLCAAAPVSAQSRVDTMVQLAEASRTDGVCAHTPAQALDTAAGDQQGPQDEPADTGSDRALDAPELCSRPPVTLPALSLVSTAATSTEALPPSPWLEGLQRPPRASALSH